MNSGKEWRVIDRGPGRGAENMATDEALLMGCKKGLSPPAVHLYTWDSPVVTLGYLQDITSSVEIEVCRSLHVPVVRRLTGGRAVVHDKDLGFSLVYPARGGMVPTGILKGYYAIAQGVLKGLGLLGIEAYMADGRQPNTSSMCQRRLMSACFLTRIRHEIVIHGRKLAGMAQRHDSGWVLLQGTLMVGIDRRLWSDLLRYPAGMDRETIAEMLNAGMTSVEEEAQKGYDLQSIKRGMLNGIADSVGIEMHPGGLLPAEMEEKALLERERYRDLTYEMRN